MVASTGASAKTGAYRLVWMRLAAAVDDVP
jgi:hypothetical protein